MEPEQIEQLVADLLEAIKAKGATFSEAMAIVSKLQAAIQTTGGGKAL